MFTLALTPSPASAAYNLYYNDHLTMNTWAWSGHQYMDGAKAWGIGYLQPLFLNNEGFDTATGYDTIFVTHYRTFTVSKCSWYSSSVTPGTKSLTSCWYDD